MGHQAGLESRLPLVWNSAFAFDVNYFPRLQRFSYRTYPASSWLWTVSMSPDQTLNAKGEIVCAPVAFSEILHHRYRVARSCVHIHNLNHEGIYVRDTQA